MAQERLSMRRAREIPGPSAPDPDPAPPVPDGPDDPARQRRLAWAVLLRRTWDLDVLACPQCGERMDLIATIEDPRVAAKILAHLGFPARAPPRGRPGQPRQQELELPEVGDEFDGIDSLPID